MIISSILAKSTAAQERELALEKLLQPLILVGDATDDAQSLDNLQSQLNFNVIIILLLF